MRYYVFAIISAFLSPTHAQGIRAENWVWDRYSNPDNNEQSEDEDDEFGDSLCNLFPVSCVNELPPPSRTGSDSGGIEALELPQFSNEASAYGLESGDLSGDQVGVPGMQTSIPEMQMINP